MRERGEANKAMANPGGIPPGEDPLTYDPTQGIGTPAWEQSRRMNAAINARNAARRRGAH